MNRQNILYSLGAILLGAALVAANLWWQQEPGPTVNVEAIKSRDLEAVVSASGKIQPKAIKTISNRCVKSRRVSRK